MTVYPGLIDFGNIARAHRDFRRRDTNDLIELSDEISPTCTSTTPSTRNPN